MLTILFLGNYDFIVFLHICGFFLLLLLKTFKFNSVVFKSQNVGCLLKVDLTLFKCILQKNELHVALVVYIDLLVVLLL